MVQLRIESILSAFERNEDTLDAICNPSAILRMKSFNTSKNILYFPLLEKLLIVRVVFYSYMSDRHSHEFD